VIFVAIFGCKRVTKWIEID